MHITPEILIFLFSRNNTVSCQRLRRQDVPFSGIRLYDPKQKPTKDFLYVLSERAFRRLSAADRKLFSIVFIAATQKSDAEKSSSFNYTDISFAVAEGFPDPGSLYFALQQQYLELLQQENELLLATRAPREEADTVFSFASKWFPWEYSIVDIDMRLIYRTPNLQRVTGSRNTERVPTESIQDLILSREFHEAAKKKAVFYQTAPSTGLTVIARNILPDDQYAGRVVMFLDAPLDRAPRGAEQLFEFYTDCVMETLRWSGHFTARTQNNPLHLLCRSLFAGEAAPARAIDEVFEPIRWRRDHSFSVVTLRFLSDTAWQAQLETTLPYLADELESAWAESCAVNTGTEINWVLNLSLSRLDTGAEVFHQKVAQFVREHICIAGASPVFQDFSLLGEAKKSATTALEIGHQKNPHIWYFLFDDYRLDFIKNELQNTMSPAFLRHPAIRVLEDFDKENSAELSATLKAYLENGRNMSAAADAIFIHRTTFCRRMDLIKKITGLNLDDMDTTLLLELSYQLGA